MYSLTEGYRISWGRLNVGWSDFFPAPPQKNTYQPSVPFTLVVDIPRNFQLYTHMDRIISLYKYTLVIYAAVPRDYATPCQSRTFVLYRTYKKPSPSLHRINHMHHWSGMRLLNLICVLPTPHTHRSFSRAWLAAAAASWWASLTSIMHAGYMHAQALSYLPQTFAQMTINPELCRPSPDGFLPIAIYLYTKAKTRHLSASFLFIELTWGSNEEPNLIVWLISCGEMN